MNNSHQPGAPRTHRPVPLKHQVRQLLLGENLDAQRTLIHEMAAELGVDVLDCAAAVLYLNQFEKRKFQAPREEQKIAQPVEHDPTDIKMVRYRLEVGRKHQVTVEALIDLLVDESGVDRNNISNVNIHGLYTILELPDGMPMDIFVHLKSVEINQQKLHIKRLKAQPQKKRGTNNYRRGRQRKLQPGPEVSSS